MATMLLSWTPVGKYCLNLMIEAFIRERPSVILDADKFFEAANVPIASLAN